jgi:hypothetical protein
MVELRERMPVIIDPYPTIPFHRYPIAHSGIPAAREPVMASSNTHSDRFRLWGHAQY